MRILITSGGTKVQMDSVRHIGNVSRGTFGSRIAKEALIAGHEVAFFCAEGSVSPFAVDFNFFQRDDWSNQLDHFASVYNFAQKHKNMYTETHYKYYTDYAGILRSMCLKLKPDIIILVAAVSDFGPKFPVDGKMHGLDDGNIAMVELPKVISQVRTWAPEACLVGFKLGCNWSDQKLQDAAWESLEKNNCQIVVANDLRDLRKGMHKLHIVQRGEEGRIVTEYGPARDDDPGSLARIVVGAAVKEAEAMNEENSVGDHGECCEHAHASAS